MSEDEDNLRDISAESSGAAREAAFAAVDARDRLPPAELEGAGPFVYHPLHGLQQSWYAVQNPPKHRKCVHEICQRRKVDDFLQMPDPRPAHPLRSGAAEVLLEDIQGGDRREDGRTAVVDAGRYAGPAKIDSGEKAGDFDAKRVSGAGAAQEP